MTDSQADNLADGLAQRWINGWRIAGWGALMSLLLIPLIAMRFTDEVQWTGSDFIIAAVLLFALGLGIELAVRIGRSAPQRLGMLTATVAGFLTIWVTGAVGIIGSENEPLNAGFVFMVMALLLGSVLVWFRPRPMKWLTAAAAFAQYGFGAAALALMPGHAVEWGVLTFFAMLWGFAAACFHQAGARNQAFQA